MQEEKQMWKTIATTAIWLSVAISGWLVGGEHVTMLITGAVVATICIWLWG